MAITESATEISGKLVFGLPKSHRSRTNFLPGWLSDMLANHMQVDIEDQSLIFTAPRGGPLRSSNFRSKVWLPATAELTGSDLVFNGLRVHDLRRSAASLAISAGANIKAVQRMLGHRTASVTLDRYAHLFDDDLRELAVRLDQKYKQAA